MSDSSDSSLPELVESILGISLANPVGRFKSKDWTYIGKAPVQCPECSLDLEVFRKPYETSQGHFKFWGLICASCRSSFGLKKVSNDDKKRLYVWEQEIEQGNVTTSDYETRAEKIILSDLESRGNEPDKLLSPFSSRGDSVARRFISPDIDNVFVHELNKPIAFIDSKIDQNWEIYSNPFLNGERPTCILLNPNLGIVVIDFVFETESEIFQEIALQKSYLMDFWIENEKLDALSYQKYIDRVRHLEISEGGVSNNELKALLDLNVNNEISSDALMAIASTLQSKLFYENRVLNSIARKARKLTNIKRAIHDLYCPRLGSKSGYQNIESILVFPNCTQKFLDSYLRKYLTGFAMERELRYHKFKSLEFFDSEQDPEVNLNNLFKRSESGLTEELVSDLRNWLVEPHFSEQDRKPLILDAKQKNLAETRTLSGFRRIRGPAGSGKSVVLAARAGHIWNQKKTVLIVTFNLTLMDYLRRLTQRFISYNLGESASGPVEIVYLNFHYLCKRVAIFLDASDGYSSLWAGTANNETKKQEILNERLPQFVNTLLDRHGVPDELMFDAILVDEGQDFLPQWWALLRRFLNPDGEMILVADNTQDLYERSLNWTEESMVGAGFSGEWATLDNSYRLPNEVRVISESFAANFLPNSNRTAATKPDDALFNSCQMNWIQTAGNKIDEVSAKEALAVVKQTKDTIFSFSDVTVLVFAKENGERIQQLIRDQNVTVASTFVSDYNDERSKKMAFNMAEATIKITTIHSFKGWEARAVIIVVPECKTPRQMAMFYTGITRVSSHAEGSYLTVVSSAEDILNFGKTFPNFKDLT